MGVATEWSWCGQPHFTVVSMLQGGLEQKFCLSHAVGRPSGDVRF